MIKLYVIFVSLTIFQRELKEKKVKPSVKKKTVYWKRYIRRRKIMMNECFLFFMTTALWIPRGSGVFLFPEGISVKETSFLNSISEELLRKVNMTPTEFTSVNSAELLNSLSHLFLGDNDGRMAFIVVRVIAHRAVSRAYGTLGHTPALFLHCKLHEPQFKRPRNWIKIRRLEVARRSLRYIAGTGRVDRQNIFFTLESFDKVK